MSAQPEQAPPDAETAPPGAEQAPPGAQGASRHGRGWLVVILPAGFVLGLIGGFLQEQRLVIGSVQLPWATVLVVATLTVTIRALSLNLATRLAGGLFFAGWLIATGLLAVPNPSGDIVFTNDVGALGYVLAACLLGAAATGWPLNLDVPTAPVARPADGASDAGTHLG